MISAFLSAVVFFIPLTILAWLLVGGHKENGVSLGTICAIVLLSAVTYGLWRWDSPPPNPLNWDIHEHQTLVNNLLSGRISSIPSHISDTFQFDGYTTLFHALIAVPQALFKPDPLLFWWFAEFLHLITTIFVSYIVAFAVTRTKEVAILSAIVGVFVFEAATAFTSLFLLPQTLSASIIMLMIAHLFLRKKPDIRILIVAGTAAFLMHFLVGLAGIGLVISVGLLQRSKITSRQGLTTVASLVFGILTVLLSGIVVTHLNLAALNAGEAASFAGNLSQKISLVRSWYGLSLFVLFPLGTLAIFRKKVSDENIVLALSILMLGITASSFPYALKLYTLARYLVHIVMALGLWFIISNLSYRVRGIAIFLVTAAFIPIYLTNITIWKQPLLYEGVATQVSGDERAAAYFLRAKYDGSDTFLVSDPSTQYILESVSGINTQGGAYAKPVTRNALVRSLGAKTREEFLSAVFSVKDLRDRIKPVRVLFVYSGKTAAWYRANPTNRESIAFNIWTPKALSFWDLKDADRLSRTFGLPIVYQNGSIVMFELPEESL